MKSGQFDKPQSTTTSATNKNKAILGEELRNAVNAPSDNDTLRVSDFAATAASLASAFSSVNGSTSGTASRYQSPASGEASQRFQTIKRKSCASPKTDGKKANLGKNGDNVPIPQSNYNGSSNRFELLALHPDDMEVENANDVLCERPSTSHQAAIAAAKRAANSPGTSGSPNKTQPKPPPIVMEGIENVSLLMQELRKIIDINKVEARASLGGMMRLYANDATTFRSIVSWLEQEKYEFHCYQLKEDRPFKVCIKGLHHSTLHSQIKEDLEKFGHKVLDVHLPQRRSEPGTPVAKPVNMFFVNIAAAANNKEILLVKALCHMRVIVEPLRKRNAVVQCHRCQQFGHTAKYCRKAHICVKCAGEHAASNCTRPRSEPCTCYNCGQQHPASYSGCPKYQAFLQRSRPKRGVGARPTEKL